MNKLVNSYLALDRETEALVLGVETCRYGNPLYRVNTHSDDITVKMALRLLVRQSLKKEVLRTK